MATPDAYFFGVEIELIAAPIRPRNPFSPEYYYEKLASWIRSFNVRAAADTLVEKYRKYPEHYNKWWITEDGSLKHPEYPCIPLEAVSPVLSTCHRWEGTIEVFWAACDRVFQMPEASHRCGSHIHVSPSPLKMFSLSQLKRVAYGVVFYEPLVEEILPRSRRNHPYCKLNTEHSDELKTIIWSSQDTESSLRRVRHRIMSVNSARGVRDLMQRSSEPRIDRRVLWNFDNVFPGCSGTIEFRGGRALRGPVKTKRWISFALAFIHLCLSEVCIFA
ncbi:SWIM zinc finger domain protein [Colletotrichum tofieldiae]|nr:SWIM zinc finger domain protein [Colletotrichum tofieldiae]GKT79304.1 SWIM zinc finger domain protein [Colletotrichum tofieldiae]GKT82474.1 SWIM zinc finger domain protein [Colletotrichum tofieldiae]